VKRFKAGRRRSEAAAKFRLTNSENRNYGSRIPPRCRGRIAIVTTREAGMRWTRMLCQTSAVNADGEGVWSWPPDAEAKFAGVTNAASDGGKKARSPGRARYKPQHHRAENAG
jgi:hypothetical protein